MSFQEALAMSKGLPVEQPDAKSTTGTDVDVNQLSFSRGTEVNLLGAAPGKVSPGKVNGVGETAPSNSPNLAVGGIQTITVPVDSLTVLGSTPGDHRAKAADAKLPDNPAPRTPVGQAPLRRGE